MDDPAVVYLALALASLLFISLLSRRRRRSPGAEGGEKLRLPPGPWTLPIIGSMHHIAGRQLPHQAMRNLARRHGWPVMLLRLGEVPTLVVSSRAGAREVMRGHDASFATRPLSATVSVLTNGGRDIIFAPYGEHWRQLRKIAVTELLTARRVRSFRSIREEEVNAMLRAVNAAAVDSVSIDMRAMLSVLVADSTVRAVMGDRCKDRDVFLRELDRSIGLAAGFNPADLWPSSRVAAWVSGSVSRAQECRDIVFGILDRIIAEHLKRMNDDTGKENAGAEEDLIDVLLRIQRDGELPLDMDSIKAVVFDIFGAGSETSATTLEWVIAELVKNPKVMKRATAEVRQAFEAGGKVVEEQLGEAVPYLHLVIRETFRLHTPLPLLLPRECREPCKVLGYDVQPGTQVLVNVWALGRDEKYWPDGPEEFRPERFEAATDAAKVDFRGSDFELLPFGAGRRMCPGMGFGLANVELALASLLLHFDWEAPGLADPAEFDMTEAFGITARRKAGLLLRPVLRVPVPGI
ncbi:hypothetical protein BRADI_1g30377v3 [Brachypodium distachyon]|uniref:Cytochrome P450 n=2 Tax=Brachypodium distachyon TaxID=15368 RepID=I1GVD7_BRADI|nr:hypothetical protein BRADI_1g30377v3 [Brachypodium distachyon]